ncbi:MAG TPA: 4,5-DOPA dioxygenase extradiol [Candidatus Binatia bacterium]|nr:4,5-DOPA dioxygenase extradiol [Candidatus Binatia bacterium]
MSEHPKRMPVAFIGHGSPMNAIEQTGYSQAWRAFGASLPRPRAILSVSAHWFTNMAAVTAMAHPRTIHDFGGFPQELFDVQYPAPGDPALALEIAELLAPAEVVQDTNWGLDHGTWSVLMHLFPKADVPVVQLSIDGTEPPAVHWEFGEKLAQLRDQGVFVLGSGNVVHNLRLCTFTPDAAPYDWNVSFDRYVRDALERSDAEALCDYAAREDGRLSVPTPEHYLPLLYPAAMRAADEKLRTIVDGYEAGALSMYSFSVS